jgi:hypothetical protein
MGYVSTLTHFRQTPGRRMGNTTRLADLAIQLLFEGKNVLCRDHHEWGANHDANKRLFDIVMWRLHQEHPGVLSRGDFMADRDSMMISISGDFKGAKPAPRHIIKFMENI